MASNKYDFVEFQFSRDVVRDFPKLLHLYSKMIPMLEQYGGYTAVWHVLQAVHESKMLMEIQLAHYEQIHAKKGLINE